MDCCGTNLKDACEQLNCKCEEVPNGIRLEVTPKDPKKAEALKALFKACRELGLCQC